MSCNECQVDLKDRGCCSSNNKGSCAKLDVYDWLGDVQNTANTQGVVEVRFKNTRKDYYQNPNNIKLSVGDVVAVEASPGHDIGIVSLVGDLVLEQMKKHRVTYVNGELRKVYRKAKPADVDKWKEAVALEHDTMLRSRKIAAELELDMKIGDVEYQGDKTKAIFYYIADERVDFRQLIKVLAETFRIRIEMKQIGARQEAGRIGGIGPCGRELCCCTWISNFVSVTTNAARYQEISLNPQKLAGQCGKLKCCLNFELDCYIDAQKDFPPTNLPLETENGNYIFLKADIFKKIFWYAPASCAPANQVSISVDRVKEIIRLNRKGKKVEKLESYDMDIELKELGYAGVIAEEDLNRFDKQAGGGSRKKRKRKKRPSGSQGQRPGGSQGQRPADSQGSRDGQRTKDASASKDRSRSKDATKGKDVARSKDSSRTKEVSKGKDNNRSKDASRSKERREGDKRNPQARSKGGSSQGSRPSRSGQQKSGSRRPKRNNNKSNNARNQKKD
ncbi:hypothetical protein EYV94_11045 [Puteibacter caeruleilacunae]|nr:hypothetical protein EYV94_11045 [Puteibacter caeruleilacunae]